MWVQPMGMFGALSLKTWW